MSFSEKLKEIRDKHKLSQEDLAAKLGVSRQSISKWENDKVLPDMEKMMLISKEFHVSMDFLLSDEIHNVIQDEDYLYDSIWDAARKNNVLEIKRNINDGIFVDEPAKNEDAATPLMIAITFGSTESVEELIRSHANINYQKTDGTTPIYLAVFFGRIPCIKILLENHADPTIQNNDRISAVDLLKIEWSTSLEYIYDFFNQKYNIGLNIKEIKESRTQIKEIMNQYGYEWIENQ